MAHHNGALASSQIISLETRIEKFEEKLEELRRVVSFYELAKKSPEARETGAMRDATEWLLEKAIEISKRRI